MLSALQSPHSFRKVADLSTLFFMLLCCAVGCGHDERPQYRVAIQAMLDQRNTQVEVQNGISCVPLNNLAEYHGSITYDPTMYASLPGASVEEVPSTTFDHCYRVSWNDSAGVPPPFYQDRARSISRRSVGRYVLDDVGEPERSSDGEAVVRYNAHLQFDALGQAIANARGDNVPYSVLIRDVPALLHKDPSGTWIAVDLQSTR